MYIYMYIYIYIYIYIYVYIYIHTHSLRHLRSLNKIVIFVKRKHNYG